MIEKKEKVFPEIGTHLYLHQQTGNCWVDDVRRPYTVIAVDTNHVTIQEAKCIFKGKVYYNTLPDEIVEDKEGETLILNWAPKRGKWQIDLYKTGYPRYAEMGCYDFQPYLN